MGFACNRLLGKVNRASPSVHSRPFCVRRAVKDETGLSTLPPTILASDAFQRLFDELLVIVTPRAAIVNLGQMDEMDGRHVCVSVDRCVHFISSCFAALSFPCVLIVARSQAGFLRAPLFLVPEGVISTSPLDNEGAFHWIIFTEIPHVTHCDCNCHNRSNPIMLYFWGCECTVWTRLDLLEVLFDLKGVSLARLS